MKRLLFAFIALGAVGLVTAWIFRTPIRDFVAAMSAPELPSAQAYRPTAAVVEPPAAKNPTPENLQPVQPSSGADPLAWTGPLPASVNLAVPFLSQAPKMDWSLPYEEACEETSAIMVDAYYHGRTAKFQPDEGDKAILDLVAFEKKLLGFYENTTAAQTAQFIKAYFGYKNVLLKDNPTVDDIKRALAHGYPVILPEDGKTLPNPNFRNGGPVYHMLVIKGYLSDGRWITNDPGTRLGANFLYSQDAPLKSNHDWNGGDVPHGKPVMLVILPN